jgi:hypothetical protein
MRNQRISAALLAGAMLANGSLGSARQPARADTASTVAIVAGAAAIDNSIVSPVFSSANTFEDRERAVQ